MQQTLLFISKENRARSQIAEGLARRYLGHRYEVWSAGFEPADRVHPMALAVMAEIGLEISAQKPKSLKEIDSSKVHLIVTLDRIEGLKIPAHIPKLHWDVGQPVSDKIPQEFQIRKFRKVRDDLRRMIHALDSRESFNA